jgi:hypothetical protein
VAITGRRGRHEASKKINRGKAGGATAWRIRAFGQTKPTTGAPGTRAGGTSGAPVLWESRRGDAGRKNLLGNERGRIRRMACAFRAQPRPPCSMHGAGTGHTRPSKSRCGRARGIIQKNGEGKGRIKRAQKPSWIVMPYSQLSFPLCWHFRQSGTR